MIRSGQTPACVRQREKQTRYTRSKTSTPLCGRPHGLSLQLQRRRYVGKGPLIPGGGTPREPGRFFAALRMTGRLMTVCLRHSQLREPPVHYFALVRIHYLPRSTLRQTKTERNWKN